MQQLCAKRFVLNAFAESGGTVEFYIGWFLPPGDTFHWTLLRDLPELGISLSVDVYVDPPPEIARMPHAD